MIDMLLSVPFSTAIPIAYAALLCAVGIDNIIRVPAFTVGSTFTRKWGAAHVFGVRDRLQMCWAKTSGITAEVVKFFTFRDCSNNHFKRDSMSLKFYTAYVKCSVPVITKTAIPNHTRVVGPVFQRIINKIFELFSQILKAGNLVTHVRALPGAMCLPLTACYSEGLFYSIMLRSPDEQPKAAA